MRQRDLEKTIWVGVTGFAVALATASSAAVTDDFDAGLSGWSVDTGSPYSAVAGLGVGGSGALDLATTASSNDGAVHLTGVTGSGASHTVTVSIEAQLGVDGTALADETAPNVNGVNNTFITLILSTTPNWWDGTDAGFGFARRADGIWGTRLPEAPWVSGWNSNTLLGFADNTGAAASSGWFKMELVLTDVGSANYDQTLNVYQPDGTLAYSTGAFASAIAVGSTVYGGLNTGFNLGASTIEEQSKVDSILFDNFSLVAVVPEPGTIALLAAGGLILIRRRARA